MSPAIPVQSQAQPTMPVAWLQDAGPLFDVLELKDVGLHCRYMGLVNFADSLDDRLHAGFLFDGLVLESVELNCRYMV